MTPQAQPQQPSQQPQQAITPGKWIEVETVHGGPYVAYVKSITESGSFVLLLALTDPVTGSLMFKQAYVLPNTIVFWQASHDPRQPMWATATEPTTEPATSAVDGTPDAKTAEVA